MTTEANSAGKGFGRAQAVGFAGLGLAALVGVVLAVGRGSHDPQELRLLEEAKRLTVAPWPRVPTLEVLAAAAGLRVLGLHAWAGRIPLALAAVAAVASVWIAVHRLVDRRGAVYASLALTTTPVFFLQGTTVLGNGLALSATAAAFSGLSLAAFDVSARKGLRVAGLLWGCLGAGVASVAIGPLNGIGVPLAAVLAGYALSSAGQRSRLSTVLGYGLLVGTIAVVVCGALLPGEALTARPHPFDQPLVLIGHGLIPWSAVAPFALMRIAANGSKECCSGEARLRCSLVTGTVLALAVQSLLLRRGEVVPSLAVPATAIAIGVALRDLERDGRGSIKLALGALLTAAILRRDLVWLPEAAGRAWGSAGLMVSKAGLPRLSTFWTASLLGFGVLAVITLEHRGSAPRIWHFRRGVEEVLRWVVGGGRSVIRGWLGLVGIAGVAALTTGVGVYAHARWLPSAPLRAGLLNAWWILLVAPPVLLACRKAVLDLVCLLTARVLKGARGAWLAYGGAALSVVMLWRGHNEVTRESSSVGAFKRLLEVREQGESVALLGLEAHAAEWNGVVPYRVFTDAASAYAWLRAGEQGGTLRYLVAESARLVELNRLHRERTTPRRNLPVLENETFGSVLIPSALSQQATRGNPFDSVTLSGSPEPQIRLGVELDGKLEILGIDLRDRSGRRTTQWVPGRSYRLLTYYRVLGALADSWQAFVHVDGQGRRFNADHRLWEGRFLLSMFGREDVLVEEHEVVLPMSFSPGVYQLYLGLFVGDTRMPVTKGRSESDGRVSAGAITVL